VGLDSFAEDELLTLMRKLCASLRCLMLRCTAPANATAIGANSLSMSAYNVGWFDGIS